jgi:RimJ/RimL family protein N-acetyltransferase
MNAAPTIETGRLLLRAHRRDDFPALAALWTNPAVLEFIRAGTSESEVWSRLLRYAGLWPILGYGFWAVEEKATGRFVGDIGLADFARDLSPPIKGIPEFGWVLDPSFHGRGYATEAVGAALQWADEVLGAQKTVCLIAPDNKPSLRVAEKTGFTLESEALFLGETILLLSRHAR